MIWRWFFNLFRRDQRLRARLLSMTVRRAHSDEFSLDVSHLVEKKLREQP